MATTQITLPISGSRVVKLHASLGGVALIAFLVTLLPWALPALLAHEFGHIAVAFWFHVRIKGIGICGKGPYYQRERSDDPRVELAITAAGTVVNLVLGALFFGSMFGLCNLVLAVTNLLPLPHSDGRKMLQAFRP